MNRHIKVIPIVGLSLAVVLALPVTGLANPLLSGYGGPGQGSQAILGSALLNGPRGGGGGAGGANGSSSAGVGSGGGGAVAATHGSGASTRSAAGGQGTASGRSAIGAGGQGDRHASVGAAGIYPASERDLAGQSEGALGLSADDLLYIIFAFGALAFAGVFTRRLTQTTAAGRRR
jgi:hypothetical protein